MKKAINISIVIIASLAMVSCFDSNNPNYQYMPNMYEPVGYDTYGEYDIFENEMEAKLPVEGSIPRGWMPYDYEDSNEGLELARAELTMTLPVTEENLERGKELYDIYCAVCHGEKGDGQGILMKREKFLGIPSYADPGRNITEGSIYHVQMYGLNSMGSYASQTNELERWQITQHVMNLMAALKGEPALELSSANETGEVALTTMENVSEENSENQESN